MTAARTVEPAVGPAEPGLPDDGSAFRILFVCTGNVCRSPFAELLVRHLLLDHLGDRAAARFQVGRAGLRAVVGAPIDAQMREELARWNLDGPAAERFVARQLLPSMVEEADLVLGAGVEHRTGVLQQVPSALGRVFSLREYARLAGEVDPAALPEPAVASARELVAQARLRRGLSPPPGPDDNDVPDPMGRDRKARGAAAVLIAQAASTIVHAIGNGSIV